MKDSARTPRLPGALVTPLALVCKLGRPESETPWWIEPDARAARGGKIIAFTGEATWLLISLPPAVPFIFVSLQLFIIHLMRD